MTSKLSNVQLDKVSASPPALKLPQLFSLTPNSSGKGGNMQKRQTIAPQTSQVENLSERISLDQPLSNNRLDNLTQGSCICIELVLLPACLIIYWLAAGILFYKLSNKI